jgi:hypothetical protein
MTKGQSSNMSSPDAAPGVQFSEEKGTGDKRIAPLSIGEGILPPAKQSPAPEDKTAQHLDKANSLLDELSREDRSGFKAEIGGMGGSMGSSNFDHSGGAKTKSLKNKKSTSDIEEDNYDDDFIEEDLAGDDRDDIDESGNLQALHKIGDSHGITVS